MDDGEVELLDHLTGNSSNTFCAPLKLEDPILDHSLKNRRTCTHDHTNRRDSMGQGRPLGNRVAVRKYREKKKAQNAYLEEEVKKLRVVNRGLIRRLQFQAGLESEALRLRSLLLDLKARIEKELSVCSFYKENCNGSSDGCNGHD